MKHLFYLLLLFSVSLSAQDNPARLLIMGDSLSAGYGMELEQSWVTLLQQRLQEQDYPYRVINASVSGETAGGGLARLPALLESHKPTLVIVELGGNDGLRGHPVNVMQQELGEMIAKSQEADADVLLVGIQIPPNYGARYSRLFAEAFPKLAEEHDVPLVPFLLEGVATERSLMQNDGIHPTAEAQAQMLDTVWPYLEPMLSSESTSTAQE